MGLLLQIMLGIKIAQIQGTASLELNETETEVVKDMSVKYMGDAIVRSPANLEEALEVWEDLFELAKDEENLKVIDYKISPLEMYCNKVDVILNRYYVGRC